MSAKCQSREITEMRRNPRKRGFVYDDTNELLCEFRSDEDMGEVIFIRAVAPWVPMHPEGA